MKKLVILIPLLLDATVKADIIVDTAKADLTIAQMKAARFLKKATMGATPPEMRALATRIQAIGERNAYVEWCGTQRNLPKKTVFNHYLTHINQFNLGSSARRQEYAWWDWVVKADDQLRFKAAHVWSQIMPASLEVTNTGKLAGMHYWEVLYDNALGTHKDLLKDVTYNPCMGAWLSHLLNSKGNEAAGVFADENYAREIMQLFTIGIYAQNKNGTFITKNGELVENYNNDDIEQLAKVFTGFHYNNGSSFGRGTTQWSLPMAIDPNFHDQSEKTILGRKFPAGRTGEKEINDVINTLTSHPSCAPFICRELIKHFTTSNPSNAYVKNAVNKYLTRNGDLFLTIREILLHPESLNAVTYRKVNLGGGQTLIRTDINDELAGAILDPVLLTTNFLRYNRVYTERNEGIILFDTSVIGAKYGRRINAPNSVFFDYSTGFAPGNGPIGEYRASSSIDIVAPAAELLPRSYIGQMNLFHSNVEKIGTGIAYDRNLQSNFRIMQSFYNNAGGDISLMFDHFNLYMCGGNIRTNVKNRIISAVEKEPNADKHFELLWKSMLHISNYAVVY